MAEIISHEEWTKKLHSFTTQFPELETSIYMKNACPHLSVPIEKIQEKCLSKERVKAAIHEMEEELDSYSDVLAKDDEDQSDIDFALTLLHSLKDNLGLEE